MKKIDCNDFEIIFQHSQNALFLIDLIDGEFIYNRVNPQHEKLTGLKNDLLRGKSVEEIFEKSIAEKILKNYKKCLRKKESISYDEQLNLASDNKIWHTKLTPVFNEQNEVIKLVGSSKDITEEVKHKKELEYLSFHDELTGVYNRRYFEVEMERLNKSRRIPIAIIIGDLDNLKETNDQYGHRKGDRYLIKAAEILKSVCREEDILSRIGGDEFAFILTEIDKSDALKFCGRIKEAFSRYNKNHQVHPELSISLGCSVKTDVLENLEDNFTKADRNMYKNKNRR